LNRSRADAARSFRELFARLVFNVLAGNTDDHARNQAAFWDGAGLILTPAFDICPIRRAGGEASQAMAIDRSSYRLSQVAACVARATTYLFDEANARDIVARQIDTIETTSASRHSSARSIGRGSGAPPSSAPTRPRGTDPVDAGFGDPEVQGLGCDVGAVWPDDRAQFSVELNPLEESLICERSKYPAPQT
jgi:hypothetical protein